MRSEEEIKLRIKEHQNSLKHRNDSFLDKIGKVQDLQAIEELEWVLEQNKEES